MLKLIFAKCKNCTRFIVDTLKLEEYVITSQFLSLHVIHSLHCKMSHQNITSEFVEKRLLQQYSLSINGKDL